MGLTISNPSTTVNSKLLVTKTNSAGQKNLSTNPYDSVTITTNTASGAFTSWVQYVASTSSDLVITGISARVAALNVADFPVIIQIGVGGAGSETALCDIPVPGSGTVLVPTVLPTPLRITSGSRVAVRVYVANTNGGSVYCALFSVPYVNLEGN